MRKLIATALTTALFVLPNIFTISAKAQKISITPSNTYNRNINSKGYYFEYEIFDLLLKIDNGYLALKNSFTSSELKRLDNNMNVIQENKLKDLNALYIPLFPALKQINGKPHLVYTIKDEKKKDYNQVVASEINTESLEIINTKKLLSTSFTKGLSLSLSTYYKNTDNALKPSQDSSKWISFSSNDKNKVFHIAVYDQHLNKIWEKPEVNVDANGPIYVKSVTVDNFGNAYIHYKKELKNDLVEQHLATYSSTNQKDFKISYPNGEINDFIITPNEKENSAFITGTISPSKNRITGLFIQPLDINAFSLGKPNIVMFQPDFIEKVADAGNGSKKSKDYGLLPIEFKGFIMNDGSLGLTGQFYYRGFDYESRGSFITVMFNKGKPIITLIPKGPSGTDRDFVLSYTPVAYKNQLMFFYNELPANLETDDFTKQKGSRIYGNYILALATVDQEGKVVRRSLTNETKDGLYPLANTSSFLSPTSFIIPAVEINGLGEAGKDRKILTINVEE